MTLGHGVILLAAGASRRLGQPKQLLRRDGVSLLQHTARLALDCEPTEVLVMLGHRCVEMKVEISSLPLRCVEAVHWQEGLGATLAEGVAALSPACEGVLVLLCDQPALDAAHLQGLVRLWRANPACAAASSYAGVAGVPALLPRHWLQSPALRGDQGARELLRGRPDQVQLLANEALARDVDSPADWPSI